jgi:hypothetical protein
VARIKGLGKRRRVKIRVSEEDIKNVIRVAPIIIMLLATLWIMGVIGNAEVFHANVTGWP